MLHCTDAPFHIYNRGVDRGTLFFDNHDYEYFLRLMIESLDNSRIDLLVYALMPNHFHLILQQQQEYAISWYMKKLCWTYSLYLNKRRKRNGHSFEGRFKATPLSDSCALLRLSHYLHANPVRAGLVNDPLVWKYSSIRGYTQEPPYGHLDVGSILSLVEGPKNYRRFMQTYDPSQPDSVQRYLRAHQGHSMEEAPRSRDDVLVHV